MRSTLRAFGLWIALGVWASACAAGFLGLWAYANTPGGGAGPRDGWTAPRTLLDAGGRPTLLLFAHPKCPCTRATVRELERLQGDAAGAFATRVLFYEPDEADASWREGGLWGRAGALKDAEALSDPGGRLADAAGAVASGTAALVDAEGRVLFWGGITPSRGHEGASAGSAALRAILRGHEPLTRRSPAFGCELGTPEPDACAGEACDAP